MRFCAQKSPHRMGTTTNKQSSRSFFYEVVLGGLFKEERAGCFTLIVVLLSVFCVSFPWRHGFVCSMWHFVVILTKFFKVQTKACSEYKHVASLRSQNKGISNLNCANINIYVTKFAVRCSYNERNKI